LLFGVTRGESIVVETEGCGDSWRVGSRGRDTIGRRVLTVPSEAVNTLRELDERLEFAADNSSVVSSRAFGEFTAVCESIAS
jgi:hypothetical protein